MTNHRHSARRNKRPKGLTLIELVVVIAIIALLAAIAYPSYINQVRKSKRAVAKSALLDASNRQEQYFFASRAYASAMNLLPGYTTATTTTLLFDKNSAYTTVGADAVYAVSATAVNSGSGVCGTAPCFQLQAIPQNDQWNDTECRTFTLTSSNAKTSTDDQGVATSNCW